MCVFHSLKDHKMCGPIHFTPSLFPCLLVPGVSSRPLSVEGAGNGPDDGCAVVGPN